MNFKAQCNHTLLILCSVLFLSLAVRVNAQKTGNDQVNNTHSTILKQSATTTGEDYIYPDVAVGEEFVHLVTAGFASDVTNFHVNVVGTTDNMSQFELTYTGVCTSNGAANVTVTFKPTSIGTKSITIQIYKDGDAVDQARVFNLSGEAIYPTLIISDQDTSVPEEKTYQDVSLTLTFIDLSIFHFISIPFTPTSLELRKLVGGGVVDLSNYELYKYHTFNRSLGHLGSNWIELNSISQMKPGEGYIIRFDNSLGFGAIITFKRELEFEAERTGTISLNDYTIGDDLSMHKNWYLVGGQVFDNYQLSGDGLLNAQTFNGTDYDLVNLATANSFKKYSAAFVQYSGTLTSSVTMNPFRAPIQQNILSGQDNYLLSLTNGTLTKQISIVTAPDGDDTYQIGKDLLMMGSMTNSPLALAIDHTSGKLVADYISNDAQTLSLLTKLVEGVDYTFSLNHSQSHAQHVYLLDGETGMQTDLLMSDYSFVGSANSINRFSLNIVVAKTPTSNELETLTHLTFISGENSLLIAGLTKDYCIHIFDVTGKLVTQVENTEEDFEVSNLENGVYIVEYTNGTVQGTEKVMIK